MIIIPKNKAYLFKEYIFIKHWDAIQGTELKDGTYFISEKDGARIPKDLTRLNTRENPVNLKEELSKYKRKELSESDFKVADTITVSRSR